MALQVIHIVGTKNDLVIEDPSKRQVPFERTIAWYAALAGVNLAASTSSTPPLTMRNGNVGSHIPIQSPDSKRSSGFWTQDLGWDSCHEVSAHDNDGIEEVFRVISKRLIEQRNKREAFEQTQTPWQAGDGTDYFSHGSTGSFRLGHGHRKSWLGLPGVTSGLGIANDALRDAGDATAAGPFIKDPEEARRKGRCC